MATIRKRGKSWQAQIRLAECPAKSKSFPTKKAAEHWVRIITHQMLDDKSTSAAKPAGYLWLKRNNRRTTSGPANNAFTQMGDITVTKLADKCIADNASSVSGAAIQHDRCIWRWHDGGKFCLKFGMQLP